MGVTREDFIRSGRYLEMSDEEWAVELAGRQQVVGCYMENDKWAPMIHKDVAVHLTSSAYGRPYLKASLETHKKLGFWTLLSYDNFLNPAWNAQDAAYDRWLPPKDTLELADTLLMPHHQSWGGVSYPYMWQLRLAGAMLQDFPYVLCSNGDCILEKPEGFPELLKMFIESGADIMSSGPTLPREIGTASFLVKGKAFKDIGRHMIDHVVPFEQYEKSTQDFGNTEGRLAVACRELGLKVAPAPVEPFNEQHHMPGGTWHEMLGFRHIHGEHNYAYRYHKIPPHHSYMDPRYMGEEYNQIKTYWDIVDAGGDMAQANAILAGWWSKD